jgi:transcriptional regulator with XRE-family HTH domain
MTAEKRSGKRLRQTCHSRGWTLTHFAKRAAISRGALYRFLNGQRVATQTSFAISHAAFAMLNETRQERMVSPWWGRGRIIEA